MTLTAFNFETKCRYTMTRDLEIDNNFKSVWTTGNYLTHTIRITYLSDSFVYLACVTKRAKSVISQDVVSNGYFGKKNKSIYFLIARFLLKIVLEERCGWYVLLSSVLSPVVGIYLQQG